MPVLDGFEVLRRLKDNPALVKPISLKELTARVELALRRHEPEGD